MNRARSLIIQDKQSQIIRDKELTKPEHQRYRMNRARSSEIQDEQSQVIRDTG
jgi:hypothetical protein